MRVSPGIASSGCELSIVRSSVVPERGAAPMKTGGPERFGGMGASVAPPIPARRLAIVPRRMATATPSRPAPATPPATAVSSLALPFGAHADTAILWLTLLSFGALVYLTYRLGEELFNRWVGLVAALVVVSRPVIMRDALIGYQDLPFAALVIGAVLLEAQRSRRGLPVLALLALAGLLRPEAWVLAGLYWLYLWPATTSRARVVTAALVAAAPLIWAGTDWIVTGDPLHSLHGTAALAEEVDRRRDPEDVPYWSVQYLGFVLRLPLLLGIPVGLVFAWFYTRRRALLLLAVIAAMLAVFAVGPVFGL